MKGIKTAALFLSFLSFTASAFAQDKVSFRLNWYIVGLHAPFLYGKERGF